MVCDWLAIKGRGDKKRFVSQAWFQIHNCLPELIPKSHSFLQIKSKQTNKQKKTVTEHYVAELRSLCEGSQVILEIVLT